ncbi:MAG: arylesterase [Vicinamibacterales bacterium]
MIRRPLATLVVLVPLVAAACGAPADASRVSAPEAAAPAAAPAPPSPAVATRRIVFLGDSLTAGLGLAAAETYPALIERRLQQRGQGWTVVNAGVSGDTSAGGVRRLAWAIEGGAAVVVVALGGNDGLRGLPVEELARNLDAIVAGAKAAGAAVILAGMEAPPNTGPDYTRRFRAVYAEVAARHRITLLPFLLDGVAGEAALNQADGIHPNPEGARRVADLVWQTLEPVIVAREKAATE